jgi:hypothetical protein
MGVKMSNSITFKISTGTIYNDSDNTVLSTTSYAGNNKRTPINPTHIQGKNNPEKISIHFIGPLPPGKYEIGSFGQNKVGANSAPLTQIEGENYGRNNFYIHGQEAPDGQNYGEESEGCVVVPHFDRLKIAALKPGILNVIV